MGLWDSLKNPPNPASQHADGDVIKRLVDKAMPQADANQRALQQAIADEKKRKRIEDRQAYAVLGLKEE